VVRNQISVDENANETPWLPLLIDSLRTGAKVKQLQLTVDAQSLDMQGTTNNQDDQIAAIFIDYADTEVIIAGYTDSSGNNAENQLLSEARADYRLAL